MEQEPHKEIEFVLPSSLRIRQKLGEISANRLFRRELIPSIAQLGDTTVTPESLITSLCLELSEFANENMLGMTALAYERLPLIIDALVDDKEHKTATLDLWGKLVTDKKEKDEAEIRQVKEQYTNPPPKLPRKMKKRGKRGQVQISRSQRRGRGH